ncbi:MAG: amidohydrolase family protein [Dehalococcoidales bacterium]|nr:amidohydrolase family protein [Dehalococcoidales bacterium]
MKTIDLEAHFLTPELLKFGEKRGNPVARIQPRKLGEMLLDVGEKRQQSMAAAGIDMQVLSAVTPPLQMFEPAEGYAWSQAINDELSRIVKKYPDKYLGLAAIAPQEPGSAAGEIERAVKKLGLQGVSILSHARNEYLDNKKYWGIFDQAEKMNVPVYIHPATPSTLMLGAFSDYGFPFSGPMLGFAADTSTHVMRLIYSGLFDVYPNLEIILGHMGEGLPYWLPRLDFAWNAWWVNNRPAIKRKPSEYLKTNFWINTSGVFFQPALQCAYQALGAERIMFGVDYPYQLNEEAAQFMKEADIPDEDKQKIWGLNAQKLFGL